MDGESSIQTPLLGQNAQDRTSNNDAILASFRRDGGSNRGGQRGARRSQATVSPRTPVGTIDEEEGNFRPMHFPEHKPTGLLATFALAYGSIGVVFGDLGTSCLYTITGIFAGFKTSPTPDDVLGAVSLIFWTITLIAVVKYIFIVLFADDNGEGGTFALYSLLCRHAGVGLLGKSTKSQGSGSSGATEGGGGRPTAPGGGGGRGRRQRQQQQQRLQRHASARTLSRNLLQRSKFLRKMLLVVVLLATSMVLGDGVLTPAISVLSAVQGIQVAGPKMSTEAVLGVTCFILLGLFLFQRFGTARVGFIFAPITICWLLTTSATGGYNIWMYGFGYGYHGIGVFQALNPLIGLRLIFNNGQAGFASLCGVILCVTGTEALFADIGHYSRASIQLAFAGFIYPCLLLNYFGQGSYLRMHPEQVTDAFWKSQPRSMFWPLLVLATMASVVASQALISGAFSLVKQSMSLNCFPRVRVIHTSNTVVGQIYIPEVNYILMCLTIAVVLLFQDSTKLGNAYGLAVASVMLLTTSLMSLVILLIWNKGVLLTLLFLGTFGTIELAFLAACLPEIPQGAWFPLALAAVFLIVMYAWQFGAGKKEMYERAHPASVADVVKAVEDPAMAIARVPGIALHYAETVAGVPPALSHSLSTLRCLHRVLIFITVRHEPTPSVDDEDRFELKRIKSLKGAYRCLARYGYMDDINHGRDFMDSLVEAVETFIRTEGYPAVADAHMRSRGRGGLPTGMGTHALTQAQQQQQQVSAEVQAQVEAQMREMEEEVAQLEQAHSEQPIYVMGRVDLEPEEGASWFRRTMLESYRVLRAFAFAPDRLMQVPHQHLLEVGMVYDV